MFDFEIKVCHYVFLNSFYNAIQIRSRSTRYTSQFQELTCISNLQQVEASPIVLSQTPSSDICCCFSGSLQRYYKLAHHKKAQHKDGQDQRCQAVEMGFEGVDGKQINTL